MHILMSRSTLSPEFNEIFVERRPIRIPLTLFWIGSSTQNIHQAIKSSSISFTSLTCQIHNSSGHYVINGPNCSGDYDCAGHCNLFLSILLLQWFCDKPEDVSLDSGAKCGVSGAHVRFKKYDIEIDRGKSFKKF